MNRILTAVAVAAVCLASNRAQADQCWAMAEAQAKRATARLDQLKPGDVILFYCEPCGMKKPERVVVYTVKDGNVNGIGLDAAYVFVPEGSQASGARKFINLAKIAGCPTSGVSPSVTVDPSTLSESDVAPKPKEKDPADDDADMLDLFEDE